MENFAHSLVSPHIQPQRNLKRNQTFNVPIVEQSFIKAKVKRKNQNQDYFFALELAKIQPKKLVELEK